MPAQHGRQVRAHHRHPAGDYEDRDAKSGLQHAPCGRARKGGNPRYLRPKARKTGCINPKQAGGNPKMIRLLAQ